MDGWRDDEWRDVWMHGWRGGGVAGWLETRNGGFGLFRQEEVFLHVGPAA